MSDNDTALERREAPGPSQGPPRPGTPTPLKAYGSRNLGADRLSQSRWGAIASSPAPPGAPTPLFEGQRKNGMRANLGPEISKNRGGEALAEAERAVSGKGVKHSFQDEEGRHGEDQARRPDLGGLPSED